MKESYEQAKIIKYLTSLGWYVIKVIVASKKGVPDIICCDTEGMFWAFECKVGKNKASPLQVYNVETINKCNGRAYVVYSLQQVKDLLAYV